MTVPDTEKLLPEIDGAPAETAKAGPQPRTVKTVKKSPMKKSLVFVTHGILLVQVDGSD
ncbi:hypothetical protein [Candidatus Accumulibacter contiguus]|uniref:hypothetical protein n=1 Tax=Candidatus Accumulibacter contiguus TaxID=2954381 RepID=UPI00145DDE1A|nr:hypothetical protein [Candidatus Accumulibacter contiguus]